MDERRREPRVRMTALSFAYMLLFAPTLAVFVLVTVSLSVSVVGVGLILLLLFVPCNRALAGLHRSMAGWVLGERIEDPYLPAEGNLVRRLGTWASDPARWRDWGWSFVSVAVGFALSSLTVGLFLGILWYLSFPLVFGVTPDGVFDMNFGFFMLDTFAESFTQWTFAGVAFVIWWYATPPLVRLRARLDRSMLAPSRSTLERRVAEVSESRAETIDHSAAELRRIERDLHDGAQARLVSLGMNLGMAEQLMKRDPAAAMQLLEEARETTTSALGDLRSVVRGIHPPVLADRGLVGAVQAMALDMAFPVTVMVTLPGRPPAPVESAAYFAVAECLANIGKHARADHASIDLSHSDGRLRIVVTDDGRGGADLGDGTGLQGVARRLAAFDGTMDLISPPGGPTTVTMELPCELSSPKISPSSGTG